MTRSLSKLLRSRVPERRSQFVDQRGFTMVNPGNNGRDNERSSSTTLVPAAWLTMNLRGLGGLEPHPGPSQSYKNEPFAGTGRGRAHDTKKRRSNEGRAL